MCSRFSLLSYSSGKWNGAVHFTALFHREHTLGADQAQFTALFIPRGCGADLWDLLSGGCASDSRNENKRSEHF